MMQFLQLVDLLAGSIVAVVKGSQNEGTRVNIAEVFLASNCRINQVIVAYFGDPSVNSVSKS